MATESNKLRDTFESVDFPAHGPKWDGLWGERYTPWDRGGPSMALHDLLADRWDLVPPATEEIRSDGRVRRKTALVPGCGRGYDVLLLSAFGYDVYGLDYSEKATKQAIEVQRESARDPLYSARNGVEKGQITWLTGDFFKDEFLQTTGCKQFDLIFDYTFLCALPPSARPAWARRISQLLARQGRLVCLEFPSGRPLSMQGPPWGVVPELYVALLCRPGEEVEYDEDGQVVETICAGEHPLALRRLSLLRPARTHEAGYDENGKMTDFISVWGR